MLPLGVALAAEMVEPAAKNHEALVSESMETDTESKGSPLRTDWELPCCTNAPTSWEAGQGTPSVPTEEKQERITEEASQAGKE